MATRGAELRIFIKEVRTLVGNIVLGQTKDFYMILRVDS